MCANTGPSPTPGCRTDTGNLPFVHQSDVTQGSDNVLQFEGGTWPPRQVVEHGGIETRLVTFQGESDRPRKATSVCVGATCPICSPSMNQQDDLQEPVTAADTQPTTGTKRSAEDLPEQRDPKRPDTGTEGRQTTSGGDTAQGPSVVATVATSNAPAAPPGPTLRMVHTMHLAWSGPEPVWRKGTLRATLDNNYYIPVGASSHQYGGPAYRIRLPDGTTADAMVCTKAQCKNCAKNGREADVHNSPTHGEPFLHRDRLLINGNIRTFTPATVPVLASEIIPPGLQMASFQVNFPQANTTTACHVCMNNCTTCTTPALSIAPAPIAAGSSGPAVNQAGNAESEHDIADDNGSGDQEGQTGTGPGDDGGARAAEHDDRMDIDDQPVVMDSPFMMNQRRLLTIAIGEGILGEEGLELAALLAAMHARTSGDLRQLNNEEFSALTTTLQLEGWISVVDGIVRQAVPDINRHF